MGGGNRVLRNVCSWKSISSEAYVFRTMPVHSDGVMVSVLVRNLYYAGGVLNFSIMEKNNSSENQVKSWICSVCGYQHDGATPPAKCPRCGVESMYFDPVE